MMEPSTGTTSKHTSLLLVVIIGGLFYLLGQYIASQPSKINQESAANREITVQGHAEQDASSNIARISLGVTTGTQPDADTATKALSEKFDAVVKAVQEVGVKNEDVKATNVSVQPVYDFNNGRQTVRGFEASESIEVTVRKIDDVGTIVTRATAVGANQVGGLQFTVDNPEQLQQELQVAAIKDARVKAEQLADALGVRLGKVKNFSASGATPPGPIMPLYAQSDQALEKAPDLPIPSGSETLTSDVTITYELK